MQCTGELLGQNREEGSGLEKGGVIGQGREVESRGMGAGTQCRLAWSRFKLMETITSPFPRLYSLHPSLSPLQALNREQRESCGQKRKRSSCGNPTFSSSGGGLFMAALLSLSSENDAGVFVKTSKGFSVRLLTS